MTMKRFIDRNTAQRHANDELKESMSIIHRAIQNMQDRVYLEDGLLTPSSVAQFERFQDMADGFSATLSQESQTLTEDFQALTKTP